MKEIQLLIAKWITDQDRERSYSSHIVPELISTISLLKKQEVTIRKILDIGCGFGGLLKLIGEYLGAEELCGIDIDEEAVEAARARGIKAVKLDVEKEKIPFPDDHFDLVMTLGVLDYFAIWDDVILELRRVLKAHGYILVSLPNLASWHNRLALLLGYQPRDIEVSRRYLCGIHPLYRQRKDQCVGHIHTITALGFKELMENFGFETIMMAKANEITSKTSKLVRLVNRIMGNLLTVNLSKRFIYLGRKSPHGIKPLSEESWWQKTMT
jgi:SAM-dependent methyltransferase